MKRLSSLQNPLVKHLVKLRKNRDYRRETQSVVIEGKKLVSEVCQDYEAKTVLVTSKDYLPKDVKAKTIYCVDLSILKKISGVEHPEGIIAEVVMPLETTLVGCRYIVALDQVSDPGNLGTLLRTALALGWEGAFILNNSCDPYNDKAIRAAKGATFRLPLQLGTWDDLRKVIENSGIEPIAADLEGENLETCTSEKGVLLVLGSEAQGLSEEAHQICKKVSIPISDKMESLNVAVAGGIMMYVLIDQ